LLILTYFGKLSKNNEKFMIHFKTIFLLLAIAFSVFPQTPKYFDAPFGGGGGYVPGWSIPNIDPINIQLKNIGFKELSTDGIYTSGGAGYIYIGMIKNLRVGGMGYSGSISESSLNNGVNQEAIYSIGGGGLTVEYTLPFIKNWGVSVGAVLGAGSLTVELYRNDGSFNWNNLFENIGDGNTSNISRTLKNNYWLFSPTLNIDIPLYRFVVFRIGAGYQLTLGNDWEVDNGQAISNVPSDLDGDAFFIQSGLFIGFFSF
jgi:hypothetical protein